METRQRWMCATTTLSVFRDAVLMVNAIISFSATLSVKQIRTVLGKLFKAPELITRPPKLSLSLVLAAVVRIYAQKRSFAREIN